MLAPETPELNINEGNLGFKLNFELNSDKNNIFTITFTADTYSCLNIQANQKNGKSFSNNFSPEKIKENKYFTQFDNLSEICNELSERIKNKSIKLTENNDKVNITISLPSPKIKEITFELNKIGKNDNEQTNDLNKLVYELKSEIELIKKEHIDINEIKIEHEKEINELKKIINEQNHKIVALEQQVKTLYEKLNIEKPINISKENENIKKEKVNDEEQLKKFKEQFGEHAKKFSDEEIIDNLHKNNYDFKATMADLMLNVLNL